MASCHKEHHAVDARVKRWFCLKSFSIPDKQNKVSTDRIEVNTKLAPCWQSDNQIPLFSHRVIPKASLIPAVQISEPGAHEHVFVDASAQTVDVWCHRLPCLHNRQNCLQRFGTVSRVVPPGEGKLDDISSCDKATSICKDYILSLMCTQNTPCVIDIPV